ncbi:hypothetical protein OGAPHI_002544 [Ogataea philodendri]|uniref:Uncharacterized protein n=1 Tax=Ogataea philodendri TaxID=1378263 RepID=A0A9P8PCK9_9ASCO|nr:uncharacterized protein OGAPHI_002544 [Ogataea philodendri]KAH3668789.1 hypothetical protein OGAPHI_002544 [Ogataea philodendri]
MRHTVPGSKQVPVGGIDDHAVGFARLDVGRVQWKRNGALAQNQRSVQRLTSRKLGGDAHEVDIGGVERLWRQSVFLQSFEVPKTRLVVSHCLSKTRVPMAVDLDKLDKWNVEICEMAAFQRDKRLVGNFLHHLDKLVQIRHLCSVHLVQKPAVRNVLAQHKGARSVADMDPLHGNCIYSGHLVAQIVERGSTNIDVPTWRDCMKIANFALHSDVLTSSLNHDLDLVANVGVLDLVHGDKRGYELSVHRYQTVTFFDEPVSRPLWKRNGRNKKPVQFRKRLSHELLRVWTQTQTTTLVKRLQKPLDLDSSARDGLAALDAAQGTSLQILGVEVVVGVDSVVWSVSVESGDKSRQNRQLFTRVVTDNHDLGSNLGQIRSQLELAHLHVLDILWVIFEEPEIVNRVSVDGFDLAFLVVIEHGVTDKGPWSNNVAVCEDDSALRVHHKPGGLATQRAFGVETDHLCKMDRNHRLDHCLDNMLPFGVISSLDLGHKLLISIVHADVLVLQLLGPVGTAVGLVIPAPFMGNLLDISKNSTDDTVRSPAAQPADSSTWTTDTGLHQRNGLDSVVVGSGQTARIFEQSNGILDLLLLQVDLSKVDSGHLRLWIKLTCLLEDLFASNNVLVDLADGRLVYEWQSTNVESWQALLQSGRDLELFGGSAVVLSVEQNLSVVVWHLGRGWEPFLGILELLVARVGVTVFVRDTGQLDVSKHVVRVVQLGLLEVLFGLLQIAHQVVQLTVVVVNVRVFWVELDGLGKRLVSRKEITFVGVDKSQKNVSSTSWVQLQSLVQVGNSRLALTLEEIKGTLVLVSKTSVFGVGLGWVLLVAGNGLVDQNVCLDVVLVGVLGDLGQGLGQELRARLVLVLGFVGVNVLLGESTKERRNRRGRRKLLWKSGILLLVDLVGQFLQITLQDGLWRLIIKTSVDGQCCEVVDGLLVLLDVLISMGSSQQTLWITWVQLQCLGTVINTLLVLALCGISSCSVSVKDRISFAQKSQGVALDGWLEVLCLIVLVSGLFQSQCPFGLLLFGHLGDQLFSNVRQSSGGVDRNVRRRPVGVNNRAALLGLLLLLGGLGLLLRLKRLRVVQTGVLLAHVVEQSGHRSGSNNSRDGHSDFMSLNES